MKEDVRAQHFLRNPKKKIDLSKDTLKVFVITLLTCYFLVILLSFVAASSNNMLPEPAIKETTPDMFGQITVFLTLVIAGPFVEEVIFRMPMDGRKISIATSLATLTFLFAHPLSLFFEESISWFGLIRTLGLSVGMFLFVLAGSKYIEPYFTIFSRNHLIYLLTFLFAVFHITNFENLHF